MWIRILIWKWEIKRNNFNGCLLEVILGGQGRELRRCSGCSFIADCKEGPTVLFYLFIFPVLLSLSRITLINHALIKQYQRSQEEWVTLVLYIFTFFSLVNHLFKPRQGSSCIFFSFFTEVMWGWVVALPAADSGGLRLPRRKSFGWNLGIERLGGKKKGLFPIWWSAESVDNVAYVRAGVFVFSFIFIQVWESVRFLFLCSVAGSAPLLLVQFSASANCQCSGLLLPGDGYTDLAEEPQTKTLGLMKGTCVGEPHPAASCKIPRV